MKSTHWNFPDSLLQQYNFDTNTTEAPAEVSKEATDMDEPEEEAVVNPQAEAHSEADEQSDQHEEEGDKSVGELDLEEVLTGVSHVLSQTFPLPLLVNY